MQPRQIESNSNVALGDLLRGMLSGVEVRSEHTQVIRDHLGKRPDNLITTPDRSPVIIEAEYLPAATVEPEAKDRLGAEIVNDSRPVEAVIALRYPEALSHADNLQDTLRKATLSWCVLTEGKGEIPHRYPNAGWLDGSVDDLADLVRLISVPQQAVDRAVNVLERGINMAANRLGELKTKRPGITAQIASLLKLADLTQTHRMACAIIANAMVFHDRVYGMHTGIQTLDAVCGPHVANPKAAVVAAWDHILTINYWPIFAIAKDLVSQLPTQEAARLLSSLRVTAGEVAATGVTNAHDLTGRIFQRLIADRKYLATFYTLPSSAALLARLAVAKMEGVDWASADAIGGLRVGDFACGTGALLSAVYEQIAVRRERAGGDLAALHAGMMEETLYGCDIVPSAIHITSSTLSGAQPNVRYGRSHLYIASYGPQTGRYAKKAGGKGAEVRVGSLELASSQGLYTELL